VRQPLVRYANISACDSSVSNAEQFHTPDDRQNGRTKHDSSVNDIQQREGGILSEYEQYDEQKPQDVRPDGCSVEGVTHILLLKGISLTDTGSMRQ
jgi:hypothetical protein